MGTWGAGNFDNDGAGEFLDQFISALIFSATTAFQAMQISNFYLTRAEETIMPSIDIIITLCTTYNAWPQIDAATAMDWKAAYLQMYDKEIRIYTPKEDYIAERREVIVRTFDKLIALAEDD